jgi:hypothetical protein
MSLVLFLFVVSEKIAFSSRAEALIPFHFMDDRYKYLVKGGVSPPLQRIICITVMFGKLKKIYIFRERKAFR